MLLENYKFDVANNHYMLGAQSVNCVARLDQDVGCAIPYLNAVIEGNQFTPDPSSITFRNEGRLISVTERTITVNDLADEVQGRRRGVHTLHGRRQGLVSRDGLRSAAIAAAAAAASGGGGRFAQHGLEAGRGA